MNERYIVIFQREISNHTLPGIMNNLLFTYEQAKQRAEYIKSLGINVSASILKIDLDSNTVSFIKKDEEA